MGILIPITNLYLNCSGFAVHSQQMCKHVIEGKNMAVIVNKSFAE